MGAIHQSRIPIPWGHVCFSLEIPKILDFLDFRCTRSSKILRDVLWVGILQVICKQTCLEWSPAYCSWVKEVQPKMKLAHCQFEHLKLNVCSVYEISPNLTAKVAWRYNMNKGWAFIWAYRIFSRWVTLLSFRDKNLSYLILKHIIIRSRSV